MKILANIFFAFILLLSFIECETNDSDNPETPVIKAVEALNNQDSAQLYSTFSTQMKKNFSTNPRAIRDALDSLHGSHIDVAILKTIRDKKSSDAATVLLSL